MTRARMPFLTVVTLFGLALFGSQVRADGDDFFQQVDVPLVNQLVFVGSVKDDTGAHLGGALVTWRATVTDLEGTENTSSGTFTDQIGRYRTLDIARVVSSYGYDFDPTLVELGVTKPGYTMVRRLRHTPQSQRMGLIQVDFVMSRAKSAMSRP